MKLLIFPNGYKKDIYRFPFPETHTRKEGLDLRPAGWVCVAVGLEIGDGEFKPGKFLDHQHGLVHKNIRNRNSQGKEELDL